MNSCRTETIGEIYEWHESDNTIVHKKTKTRRRADSYEAQVDVYEDRVNSWFLKIAYENIKNGEAPADYVAVMIALGYIEGVEQFRQGKSTPKGKSGKWFKKSASRIFPSASESSLDQLWKNVRCGIFHTGFTEGPTILSHGGTEAITLDGAQLRINPAKFVEAVIADFKNYISDLRNNATKDLARKFSRLWTQLWDAT